MRPQRTDDQAIYRKRDWPDTRAPGLLAHQASDLVLAISGAEPVVQRPSTLEICRADHLGILTKATTAKLSCSQTVGPTS